MDNKFGYIGQVSSMRSTIAKDSEESGPCHFGLMGKPMERENYAFAFRKNSNYAKLFDKWFVLFSDFLNFKTDVQ